MKTEFSGWSHVLEIIELFLTFLVTEKVCFLEW